MALLPLLEVDNVSKRFGGIVALDAVSFTAEAGEIVGLIGPNGAGKTTAFNVITRLYTPDEGDVRFDGETLLDTPPSGVVRRGIARTFQNVELFRGMTVLDNVRVGAHARAGEPRPEDILFYVSLHSVRYRSPLELPYATQKRVERLRDDFELTILLVEHHMGLVMSVADRVHVLDFGKKIAEGTPREIQANQSVIEAYLGTPKSSVIHAYLRPPT
jgi:branched-chain amino acid transport system ATP-binding protein